MVSHVINNELKFEQLIKPCFTEVTCRRVTGNKEANWSGLKTRANHCYYNGDSGL